MTNPLIQGYDEGDYDVDPYMGGNVQDFYGMQVMRTIASTNSNGMQVNRMITSSTARGMQVTRTINTTASEGMQVNRQVNSSVANGLQILRTIVASKPLGVQVLRIFNFLKTSGMQVTRTINATTSNGMQVVRAVTSSKTFGMQIRRDKWIAHWRIGYDEAPYGTTDYLAKSFKAQTGWQVKRNINLVDPIGMQVGRTVTNKIIDGMQIERVINANKPLGMQINRLFANITGMQVRVVLYNTNKLRVMLDFPSRGLSGAGNNAWGQPKGAGLTWIADTTAVGDFSPNNLNTDIVEQVWRGTTTSALLSNDSEVNQGVTVDTIAILNHNFTSSAIVIFESSDDENFSPVRQSIGLAVDPTNMYYIAPMFPTKQYRYNRVNVSDPTNPNGFLQVGTIIFGSASIFTTEDISDKVSRSTKHFADKIKTEGFTNVSNDRAIKRSIQINFDQLQYDKGDINILFDVFARARTSLKALWIPVPKDPKRFAVFAKLPSIPDEQHNPMGPNESDTVDIVVQLDESL